MKTVDDSSRLMAHSFWAAGEARAMICLRSMTGRIVVTGSFSYIGAAVSAELLRRGFVVHTLRNRRPPAGTTITHAPLRFDPDHLLRELTDAAAFINTYWIRFPWVGRGFSDAARDCATLIEAAAHARVGRIVHVSVSNASEASGLEYYSAKSEVERLVRSAGPNYAIVRPTLVVGPADVLTNNIAWLLRRFPFFLLPGGGAYRLQPVTLEDAARLVVDAALEAGNLEEDAAGPEIFTFAEYVRQVASACGLRRLFLPAPDPIVLSALGLLKPFLRDIVLTRDELAGLQQELLVSRKPALGRKSVSAWIQANGSKLGREYVNDLDRHFRSDAKKPIVSVCAGAGVKSG
ncbi:MAG: NAD(P)H-binding protein [Elusimicrobia bacterium]|nr:NAD(P)H-binding protein [Elusimicrobiota bacterium]